MYLTFIENDISDMLMLCSYAKADLRPSLAILLSKIPDHLCDGVLELKLPFVFQGECLRFLVPDGQGAKVDVVDRVDIVSGKECERNVFLISTCATKLHVAQALKYMYIYIHIGDETQQASMPLMLICFQISCYSCCIHC